MKGFFTRQEIDTQAKRKIDLSESNCLECGLYRTCKSPKMEHTGSGKFKALLLAEAPGGEEDKVGRQLVGESGSYLKKKLLKYGYTMNAHFYKLNAVNCRPTKDGSNRTPTGFEIDCCRPSVLNTINELQPEFVLPMGESAIISLLGSDFDRTLISRWRGLAIPDQELKTWLLPLYHPSYAMRMQKDANMQAFYEHDIHRSLRHIRTCFGKLFPSYTNQHENIIRLYQVDEITSILDKINAEAKEIAFDYETTGLKPYVPGHKIVSASMCFKGTTYTFPYQYRSFFSDKEKRLIGRSLRRILKNENIRKIAHNAKFEHIWSRQLLNTEPVNWHWCTLQGAHIIDNRQQFTNLKFQVYINFGQRPYDKNMKQYIRSGEEFNNIEKCPIEELLLYNGLDSQWDMLLYYKQKEFYNKNKGLKQAFDLFNKGSITLANVQHNGIHTDEDYCEREQIRIKKRVKSIESKLQSGEEAELFKQHTGRPLMIKEKDFSDHDLRILFFDILQLDTDIHTEKTGQKSVSEKALNSFNNEFANLVLKRRKLRKIEGTYLSQFIRETYNGYMHPFSDLIVPVTYRGSVSNPSLQNIPKKDKSAKRSTRRAIIPSKGNQLLESDFSGIEVAINACYNKDPNLIKYVTDKTTDMHRDTACDTWMLDESEITKDIRSYSKNTWVFPQFYGSWYEECAKNLWDLRSERTTSGFTLYDHMMSKGINDLEKFTEHCKKIENIFWNERFPVYKEWKNKIQKLYRKQGYIETFFGFRFNNYMSRNDCTDYQAQGTAFHVLLWTLIHVYDEIIRRGLNSKIIGQIHDSMITDLVPKERDEIIEIINHYGTKAIKKYEWIIVPLEIDHEITPIDGSWYEKEELKLAA